MNKSVFQYNGFVLNKIILIAALFLIVPNYAFPFNSDIITRAISEGDCETLYAFVSNPAGSDPKVVANANQIINKYTTVDSATARYRTNKMDPRIRSIGKELAENVFLDPEKYLPDVVTKLTAGINDQFSKTKVLHDWICDNIAYDVETAFSRANRRQDYISVLKVKKAVCAGYTNLFNRMCTLASIESMGISGFSKGFGYTGEIGSRPDHDWNAVKINNKWYLIDVTWDAGHVERRTFIKRYSTNYLFLDSRPFLYSHLPLENKHQFYAPVLTRGKFMEEPYIPGIFFNYRLNIRNDSPRYNNLVNKEGIIVEIINQNANVMLSSMLRTKEQADIEGASWQKKTGNTVSFLYDVPDTNSYKGFIFARLNNEKKIQEKISINMFEQKIIPLLGSLLENKKITEKEKDYFINSYFKVTDNGHYYFLEDQFDTTRNNALIKLHPLAGLSLELLEPVLDFNLKAGSGYAGYKNNYARRFPDMYTTFKGSSNTSLVSPINGVLTAGAAETFIIESKDFSKFAIIINGEFTFFEKNKHGAFELPFQIPSGIDELIICGTKDNRNYSGLLRYHID